MSNVSCEGTPSSAHPDILLQVADPPSHGRLDQVESARKEIRIFCWLVAAALVLLGIVFIVMIGFLLAWSRCTNRSPTIEIESALVSPINASSSPIIADWTIQIWVRNPNRFTSITYKHFEVSTYNSINGECWLATDTVSPFTQKSKKETTLVANLKARPEALDGLMVSGRDMHGSVVSFNIKMLVVGNYICEPKLLDEKHTFVVFCGDVKVGFSPNATQATMVGGEPKKCSVDRHLSR